MTAQDTIATVCARVGQDVDGLTERVVARIRQRVPAYAGVEYQDQYDYIRAELVIMVDCLARLVPLPERLVEETRELGMRRARQGMTLHDVVQSYHLAMKVVWSDLVEQGGEAAPALLEASSYLWDNVHVLTSAVAEGHSEATRSEQAVRAGLRFRLLEALSRWPASIAPDLEGVASRVGYGLAGSFVAVVTPGHGWSEQEVESFQSVLERNRRAPSGVLGVVQSSRVRDLVVTLAQGTTSESVVQSLRGRMAEAPVGVGMARPGVAGAAASIQDARLALNTAGPGEVVHFHTAWTAALLAAHPEQSAALLADGIDVAHQQEHLAEAVLAYADNGFSVSAAARALHLHANSVTYRLDRWHELTGWNPRTFEGLALSSAALRLGHARERTTPATP